MTEEVAPRGAVASGRPTRHRPGSTISTDTCQELTGDRAGAEQLHRALRVLADQHRDLPLGRQIEETLSGRRTVRELVADPELLRASLAAMRRYVAELDAMSPEQRRQADRAAEAAARLANPG